MPPPDHATTGAPALASQRVVGVVKRTWGFDSLRPLQAEAIDAAVNGRDALVVMPTGGGKSLCYQAPPLITGRLTVVVSPLISLMKDQVDALKLNGYPAACLHSGCTDEEARSALSDLFAGRLKLLFVSPERLLTDRFLSLLDDLPRRGVDHAVARFAIDEAHCISHWGHDFRQEYRRLATLRGRFPGVSVQAFTATATPRVREDIVAQLELRDPAVLVGTFDRPNLVYRVIPRVRRDDQITEIIDRHRDEAVIVYCISRKETEMVAAMLRARGVSAEPYHAGMTAENRRRVQEDFSRERLAVVVATVAFGMGIDRSNVRCVIHAGLPKSVEAYQQETGRAGRDGLEAECALLYSAADVTRWTRLLELSAAESASPPEALRVQLQLLDRMQRFAAGMTCRHKALSEHFGQQYPFPNCNACDVCLDEVDQVPDSTVVAQKILSCVARAAQHSGIPFGAAHIADVLRGSQSRKIIERGHDRLSTFALLKDVPRPTLMSYINQLLDQGLLDRAEGQYPTLLLNDSSYEVLRSDRSVRLLSPRQPAVRKALPGETQLSQEEQALFDSLRALRRRLAEERGVPPYIVFGDQTLRQLAAARPGSLDAFARIRGVGSRKLDAFGQTFVQHIRDWCARHNLPLDADGGATH